MNEIICPHCGGEFSISEEEYAIIAEQVRTREFERELQKRLEEMTENYQHRAEEKMREQLAEQAAEHEKQLQEMQKKQQETEELLQYYKDLKTRMSTKMIGETLEQHCELSFERVRSIGFENAQFGKDNDASEGSKGDYIFRDYDDNGMEYISIMFEMKNESELTEKKHKNRDFFAKLDTDRTKKHCEYAVLVSMLEADSELYNDGIVDVSHEYPKMYVIRPQFFIPMITLLRNMARNGLKYQQELDRVRRQSADVEHFEEKLGDFKEYIRKNYKSAGDRFDKAIDDIDKAIKELEDVKTELDKARKYLQLSDKKTDELTIRKLTTKAPAVKAMFDALRADK